LRIIFAGTPETAVVSLLALIESEHEVVAVITRPDARSGRGQTLHPSPVAIAASERKIPVLKYSHLRDPSFHQELKSLAPDVCAVVAYGALIPSEILMLPKFGWINLHFSLLPAWRGAAPVPFAIKSGDEITGATTFQIDEGLDTGPVYGVVTERIDREDTAGTLLSKLAVSGAQLLVQTLSGISNGDLRPVAQNSADATFSPKITSVDTQINWEQPALAIERAIRAYTPEPGAWTSLAGERIQLGPITILDTDLAGSAGELIITKHEVFVVTGSTAIKLGLVRPAGKKQMQAADWARGARLSSGAVFSLSKS